MAKNPFDGDTMTDLTARLENASKTFANYVTARRFAAKFDGLTGRTLFIPRESDGRIVVVLLDAEGPLGSYAQAGFFIASVSHRKRWA